jgi:hypothetical protein
MFCWRRDILIRWHGCELALIQPESVIVS